MHETRIRVRYPETDPQGVVHHAYYLQYFEIGRTELLRARGLPYQDMERQGHRLVVSECQVRYLAPGYYDDMLVVRTRVERVSKVRIYLTYEVLREETGELVAEGATTLASVDEAGRPRALPEDIARLRDDG